MEYISNIGKKVKKCTIAKHVSLLGGPAFTLKQRPYKHHKFKSGLYENTIKGVINHPVLNVPAYTFVEDESYVECRRCEIIE
jgi:hypothetical protein